MLRLRLLVLFAVQVAEPNSICGGAAAHQPSAAAGEAAEEGPGRDGRGRAERPMRMRARVHTGSQNLVDEQDSVRLQLLAACIRRSEAKASR
jgi:hypothetical protein